MATQFELRLIDADAPSGQLDANDLLAIVTSLRDISTRLGRAETEAAVRGRPSRDLERVARLRVGLAAGSTRITFARSSDERALDFDLTDEAAVDRAFEQIIEGVAADVRPDWVTDSVADSVADLAGALQHAAPDVEFSVGGIVRTRFKTATINRTTWRRTALTPQNDDVVVILGRLEKVDIKRHDFRVRDDIGVEYALPKVTNDTAVMHLIGSHVRVEGPADRDALGRIAAIREARITETEDPIGCAQIMPDVPLDDILNSAPGPSGRGIPGLTEEEANAFFEALRS